MFKKLGFLIVAGVFLVSQVQPRAEVEAAPGPEFFAAPSAAAAGGVVVFTGYGFTPDDVVELHLLSTPDQLLGFFQADGSGQLHAAVELVDTAPGVYQVMAAPYDVFTTLTILPPLGLVLFPISGPPGAIVHFTVNNLSSGEVRLDYAGKPVFGPVPVDAGLFEGDFLVPGDRPNPLGVDAEVKAYNLLGSQRLATARGIFGSKAVVPPAYSITDLVLPVDPVAPGYSFTISGKILPVPPAQSASSIQVLWKSASGQVAPITAGTPVILPDGSFTANAHAPSLLAGDPLIPEAGGQVAVAFINQNNGPVSLVSNSAWGIDPPAPVFRVKVVDPQNNPIQNALVDIRAFYSDFKKVEGETTGGTKLGSDLSSLQLQNNQITAFLGQLAIGESDPFTCTKTNVYGRTDANGIFEVKFDPALIAAMGEKIFLGNLPKPTYMETPMEITFPLYVNGTHMHYGVKNDSSQVIPEPFTLKIRFSHYTNFFYNAVANTKLETDPLVVTLYPLPPGTQNLIPIVPKITGSVPAVGGFKNYLGTGYPMTAFGNFYSFASPLFLDSWFTSTSPKLQIEFQHDAALFGALDETKLTFKLLPNGPTYPFVYAGEKFAGQVGCNAVVYRATIPNFHRMAAGSHTGMIEISDTANPANITRHYIQLNFVPAPTWIQSAKFKVRSITVTTGYTSLIASQFPPGDPSSSSNLDTDVPKVGPLKNRVSNQDEVRQYLYPDKNTGIQFDGYFGATVLNESTGKKTNASVAGGSQITFGPATETVLNTGKMTLYRHVFGIPPIAGATIGADMWFDATLTYDGLVKFLPAGGTSTTLTVTPDATVGVDAFFDGEVLFGLVDAEAHAVPSIGLKMPTTFTDGSLIDTSKCFHYKLDVSWEVSAGVWPFEYSKSGTEHVFNGSNPNPCPASNSPAAEVALPAAPTASPPAASPSLAVDGFGHTLMLWVSDGNIWSRPMSGGKAGADVQVSFGSASSGPQAAFYAPNKAAAVWVESSLTALQSQTAGLGERIDAQHLKYALWNGTAWSTSASLTLPGDSGGEGKAVLAGCMSTNAGCPAVGEVTAVWVRNMAAGGDISARQFSLYFTSFNGTTWAAPQAVDPASAEADTEADLVYLPGAPSLPLVVWVRDADRSLSTSTDRHIARRVLSPNEQVVVDTSLPGSAVEPSLAVNDQNELVLAFTVAADPQAQVGNQRQLHVARYSCPDTCGWAYQALVDANGRPIHAEGPQVTLNASGQAQVTYRALGFGSSSPGEPVVMKGDALGTILGTGEIAQAFVDFTSNIIAPSYLTNTGNTVWQVSTVFDPLFNQVYTAGSLGSSPVLGAVLKANLEAAGYSLDAAQAAGPLVFAATKSSLDLAVSEVTPSTLYPNDADGLTVTVSITGNGAAARSSTDVLLTWDGPAGVGAPAGGKTIPVNAAGPLTLVEFSTLDESLVLPAFPHLPHILYAQVNPSQTLPESDITNNTRRIFLGGLPAPQGLEGSARAGDSSVFLRWLAVEHPAVKGYRIYRSSDGRLWEPVGSAFGTGFVDLSAVQGLSYWYAAVAYSEDGFESPFSNQVEAVVGNLMPVYLPMLIR